MKRIIYYVATSLDGYISAPNEDISQFVFDGKGVEKYQADLLDYKTVIMGRKTYEFGYKFGLPAGQPAYPHMEHFIFSDTLQLDNCAPSVHVEKRDLHRIREIKASASTDIYLCGGGQFAGWLFENQLIDQLKLKLNPIVLGGGVRLFGDSKAAAQWVLTEKESFENSLQILTYGLK